MLTIMVLGTPQTLKIGLIAGFVGVTHRASSSG